MKRPFLAFCAVVILPGSIAAWAVQTVARVAWQQLESESVSRSARLALGTLDSDLSRTLDSLIATAEPLDSSETNDVSARLAFEGDTIAAFDPTGSEPDVMVLLRDPGDTTRLLFNQASLELRGLALVGAVTRADIGIFADGILWRATETAPTAVPNEEALLAATSVASGVAVGAAHLVAMDPRPGSLAAIAALVQPHDGPDPAVPQAIQFVIALLFVFAATAGWILFAKGSADPTDRARSYSAVVLALVPALTVVGLASQVGRSFEGLAREQLSRDLSRTLAVASNLGRGESPESVLAMSGFHGALVEDGAVTATTLSGSTAAIEALPAPPPSFTASGLVDTPDGSFHYVARRTGARRAMIVLAQPPTERVTALRTRVWLAAGLLVLWLALAGAAVRMRTKRTS